MRNYWQLSFAEPNHFLGGLILEGEDFILALAGASSLGLNPGGEVQGIAFRAESVDPHYLNRLLSAQELEEMPEPEGADLVLE